MPDKQIIIGVFTLMFILITWVALVELWSELEKQGLTPKKLWQSFKEAREAKKAAQIREELIKTVNEKKKDS